MDIAIGARRIVTPTGEVGGVVRVRDGLVAGIEPAGTDADLHLDDRHVLLPGLVDSHVHVNEPGRTEWEGFETATAAALSGGVTTIVDMPLNSIPPTVDVAALEAKLASTTGKLAVDVAFWGGAVPGNVSQLRPLHDAGVVGFKCFLLPSGVDEFPPLDPDELAAAMAEIASFDGLLIAHAEDPAAIDAAPPPAGRSYAGFLASRPDTAEASAIRTLLAAAERTGCRTHVVHLSSAESLPLIADAKARGVRITAETCPHYLYFDAEHVPDGATQYKCCPPIRTAANCAALWDGLVAGVIDCVVSDHSPCTVAAKRLDSGDFGAAWGGIASVQLGLAAVWTAGAPRGVTPVRLAEWMSAAPARLVGLTDRGAIVPGLRADFCVFDPEGSYVVDPARLRHRNPVSPYAGNTVHGTVVQTWLAGAPVEIEQRAGQIVLAQWR